MKRPENFPRPQHLVGVYRPLADTAWAEELHEKSQQFRDVLDLRRPEQMIVHLFTERELGTADINSKRHAMLVRKELKTLLPDSFREEMTVAMRGLTAIGHGRRFVIGKLEIDDRLSMERYRAAEIIPWQDQAPDTDGLRFQLSMGKLYDARRKLEVVRALDPLMPAEITLAPGKAPAV